MSIPAKFPIQEAKIRAHLLHKAVKQLLTNADNFSSQAYELAKRFQKLPFWSDSSLAEIASQLYSIQRKHCLEVIALEQGYQNWPQLLNRAKNQTETRLYKQGVGSSLNIWYADYAKAKKHLVNDPNAYLLVYQQHYFICTAEHIAALGFDPADPDWEKIGRDWAQPQDAKAHARLSSKLK
ncbi:MAG: hypothetical protein K0S11_682 [Gammaproteobacteria bacterium]|jgi:hypothetical protein|nr:hypothetical protein [Gammaproteobacteria bacterium]